MNRFMLGKKAGMTQLFDEQGLSIPVTVIDCGPITVVQNKTKEIDGYQAVKVGYGENKKANKPATGEFSKIDIEPMRVLREFQTDEDYETGQVLKVDEMFESGDHVDVTGTSKGKGYQGVVRRHGFSIGRMSHGSKFHRTGGSIGSSATPGKIFKGKKMSGQMGNKRSTVQNLEVVQVDGERNILVVKGAVPGPKGGILEIKTSVKNR
ncbi:MAG: 50S ribosomal protein L3 [Clostridiaceae bacterium]|nr:50S ribosomal protein L3 [Clostridiaceae bacterium]